VEHPAGGVDDAKPPAIILVGMMGSGKSTVGQALSRRTGWRYVDNDDLVRSISGRGATEIRATDGEDVLHDIEELARPETLLAHIGDGAGRRAEATDAAWVAARASERAPLYAEVASQIIDVDDRSPDEVAGLILDGLSAR